MSNRALLIGVTILLATLLLGRALLRRPGPPPTAVVGSAAITPSPIAAVPQPEVSLPHLSPRKSLRKFEMKDFGRLPKLPAGYQGGDTFEPLITASGSRLPARVRRNTTIAVGKGSCPVAAGTTVNVLARRGTFYIADVSPPCQTTKSRIREGYVPVGDVETVR